MHLEYISERILDQDRSEALRPLFPWPIRIDIWRLQLILHFMHALCSISLTFLGEGKQTPTIYLISVEASRISLRFVHGFLYPNICWSCGIFIEQV